MSTEGAVRPRGWSPWFPCWFYGGRSGWAPGGEGLVGAAGLEGVCGGRRGSRSLHSPAPGDSLSSLQPCPSHPSPGELRGVILVRKSRLEESVHLFFFGFWEEASGWFGGDCCFSAFSTPPEKCSFFGCTTDSVTSHVCLYPLQLLTLTPLHLERCWSPM